LNLRRLVRKILRPRASFSSGNYWEYRYADGGSSGDGSYGRLADFKAEFINEFIRKNKVERVIEFGCGDGNQLSLLEGTEYLGLDVSATVIGKCGQKFEECNTRSFIKYDPDNWINHGFVVAELVLSLDVLYHLVEQDIFLKYLNHLFEAASDFVIIYSTNFDCSEAEHIRHREFTSLVSSEMLNFELVDRRKNLFAGGGAGESDAEFFVYRKIK
jgi:hypothetical protein